MSEFPDLIAAVRKAMAWHIPAICKVQPPCEVCDALAALDALQAGVWLDEATVQTAGRRLIQSRDYDDRELGGKLLALLAARLSEAK